MCQVHTGAYVSLLEPGKTDYTACHPGKTTTHILHVVPIPTHTHVRGKSNGKKKLRKYKRKERKKRKEIKRKRKRKGKKRKDKQKKQEKKQDKKRE